MTALIKTTITKIKEIYCYDNGRRQDEVIFENHVAVPTRDYLDNGRYGKRYDDYRDRGMIYNKKFANVNRSEINDGVTYFQIVYTTTNGVEVLDIQPYMQVTKTKFGKCVTYWHMNLKEWGYTIAPKFTVMDRTEDYKKVDA